MARDAKGQSVAKNSISPSRPRIKPYDKLRMSGRGTATVSDGCMGAKAPMRGAPIADFG